MSDIRKHHSWGLVGAMTAAFVVGCGGKPLPGPELVAVRGQVRLQKKPLAGATVTYIPDAGTPGTLAFGVTDNEGRYELETIPLGKGVRPGDYKVTVNKMVLPNGGEIPPDTTSITDLNPKQLLDKKVASPEATQLRAKVDATSPEKDFDLR